ncbi:MAG: helix-turn-helix transcriptional regulator [bacterium]
MKSIGTTLREIRESKKLLLREVAAAISIDPTLLSKIERNERMPTKEQANSLARFFKKESNEIFIAYLSDKVFYELKDEDLAVDALQVAEEKIKYNSKNK